MSIYAELPLLATVVVFVVDLSGFTASWRGALARFLKVDPGRLRPLRPFDCSLCMTWWTCLAWALARGGLSLLTVAESAALAWLSVPIANILIFIHEWATALLTRGMPSKILKK